MLLLGIGFGFGYRIARAKELRPRTAKRVAFLPWASGFAERVPRFRSKCVHGLR